MADTLFVPNRRILRDIDPSAWEHPADRAALQAARRIPVFDQVLRTLFGLFGEKPIRLAFQANAVKVGPHQFPEIWAHYLEVCETLDVKDVPDLFISQTPLVNAGAYGMDKPFIVMNSGMIRLLDRNEMTYILGHELGHVLSGHTLYRTMIELLLQLAQMGFPVIGLAARVVLVALLEWQRKSELSADRAGLLALQQPETTLHTFMRLAGGGLDSETNLNQFLIQADQYREGGDALDSIFKVLNLMAQTHPFYVLRAGELRQWIEDGEYDRILRGEYRQRTDGPAPYKEDLAKATQSYKEGAQKFARQFTDALKQTRDKFSEGFRRSPDT
jgi:Zn-dependent protease with chaperone function